MGSVAIRTRELTKYYGTVVGVEDLSLEVADGEIFGFLGANGAGKTTTIRLLLDLLRPTRGTAELMGLDCHRHGLAARRHVGYLPAEMPMYPDLTGDGYLSFLASLGAAPSRSYLDSLLRRFNVSAVDLKRRMRDYSHGMKRKLGLVQALMTEPRVLILDEPTQGLDPLMIEAFVETIDELARSGRTTVLLSSHVLSEVDRMCHRIGLIRHGQLVSVQTLAALRAATPRRVTVTFSLAVEVAPGLPAGWTLVSRAPDRWVVDARGPIGGFVASLGTLPVADLHVAAFSLEDATLRLYEGSPS